MLIPVVYFANNPTRNASRHDVWWNVFCDDTTRANNRIIPDGDAWINNHMTSDPDVIANRYRKRVHLAVFSQFMVYRVSRNGKSNVGCNQYVITDCYRVVIDNG